MLKMSRFLGPAMLAVLAASMPGLSRASISSSCDQFLVGANTGPESEQLYNECVAQEEWLAKKAAAAKAKGEARAAEEALSTPADAPLMSVAPPATPRRARRSDAQLVSKPPKRKRATDSELEALMKAPSKQLIEGSESGAANVVDGILSGKLFEEIQNGDCGGDVARAEAAYAELAANAAVDYDATQEAAKKMLRALNSDKQSRYDAIDGFLKGTGSQEQLVAALKNAAEDAGLADASSGILTRPGFKKMGEGKVLWLEMSLNASDASGLVFRFPVSEGTISDPDSIDKYAAFTRNVAVTEKVTGKRADKTPRMIRNAKDYAEAVGAKAGICPRGSEGYAKTIYDLHKLPIKGFESEGTAIERNAKPSAGSAR